MKITAIVVSCIAAMVAPQGTTAQICGSAGLITSAGSTTVAPVTKELADEYKRKCGSTTFDLKLGGSSIGAKTVCAVTVNGFTSTDIGNMSREWKGTEATTTDGINFKCVNGSPAREVVRVPVALDGLTFIIEKGGLTATSCIDKLPSKSLTTKQLRWIYSNLVTLDGDSDLAAPDAFTNTHLWSEISTLCTANEIKLVAPGTNYGTHDFFKEILFTSDGETFRSPIDYQADNSQSLQTQVLNTDYSIGFVGYSYYALNDATLQSVGVSGLFPTALTLTDGTYVPFSRSIYSNFWKDSASLLKTKCFADYHFSAVGAAVVAAADLLPTPQDQWATAKKSVPGTCAAACPKCGFFRRLFGLCKKC